MDDNKDAERLRAGQSQTETSLSQGRGSSDLGTLVLVGKTTSVGTYPTDPGVFYWVEIHAAFGDEIEGDPGELIATGGKFLAKHSGTTPPPVDSEVICVNVNYRWVFEY